MNFDSPEVVEVLKQQQRFYEKQLRLISIALSAIEAGRTADGAISENKNQGKDTAAKEYHIPWTREIDQLLKEYDEFTIITLQNDLVRKRGINSALSVTGRNVISNTLSRFIKRGRIKKLRPGVYQVITESLTS